MALTEIPFGSPLAGQIRSAGLFALTMARPTVIGRLAGKFPKQADAERGLRLQSANTMPIVRCRDLEKAAGDEVTFDLVNPIKGKPIMGDAYAEGQGEAITFATDRLRINQTRKPVSAGGSMTQQRTKHQLRELARAQGEGYMMRLEDQLAMTHLAGSRGFANDGEWVVPLASDPDFSAICVNPVKAPTRNRHWFASADSLELPNATGGEVGITTADLMTADTVDALRVTLDSMAFAPPGVEFPGDEAAKDNPARVLLVSPAQYNSIIKSGNFRTWQANAMARSRMAKDNPLFLGEAGLWNGVLIVKMPKPIRFFAGDPLRYCADFYSEAETATDVVPAAFGAEYAVDRAVLLGGQALAEAYGKARQTGNPYFWSEKELDHGDKIEVLLGMINGKSKVRFEIEGRPTDFGVIAIDTAVKLVG